jgi:hypothetical protein
MSFNIQIGGPNSLSARAATLIWVMLIALLTVGGSLAFACAAPLAAVAALAGGKMNRGAGVFLVTAAWLSNQIVGFAVLDYPQTFDSFAWGSAIGVASILAFFAAHVASRSLNHRPLGLAASFFAAFAAYEFALYVVGIPLGASQEAFSGPIVGRVLELNLISFAGLLLIHWLAVSTSLLPMMTGQSPKTA